MSIKFALATAALFVGSVLATEARADDSGNCSNATLHGSYGLHATGTVIDVGNFAAVGRFAFDGKGSLTAKLFVRINSNNIVLTITGTYSVNPDCTVSDTWKASNGGVSTHESVIVDEGKGYFILNNTPGDPSVISGEGRKQ